MVTAAALARAFAAGRADAEDLPAAPVLTGPNPYRGLAAFRETDSHVFFGRDALIEQLLARIARTRAVTVVGPSGSGKSSVVRAGVLPQLRDAGAFVTTMVPGTRPLAEMEVALSRVAAVELHGVADEVAATPAGLGRVVRRLLPGADGELVLVVDQFEELFTLAEPTERDLLLQALHAVVDDPGAPVRVVATLRADFLGQVLTHPIAGPLVRDRAVMVGPLTDDELHQVVVGPAEVAGVAVEPALATAIVADAARSPGSLPMVQFALTEVFEAAADGTMTLDAYRRIGGIEGVLGQRAEEVYAGLDDAGQRAAHQLFQRLVVPNADGPPTRRRAPRAELTHVEDAVIEAFGRARLLRFDHDQETREPTVEVTHEALFRAWPRLVAWIEEGEDDLRLLGHLTVAAGEWDDSGRAEADLYRGTRLDAAIVFAADHRGELSDTETAFVDASRARRAREAEADRRTLRRLRALTGGLAVGLVLALVAGSLALVAERRESDARQQAEAARQAQEVAAADEAETARRAQADAFAFAASSTYADDPDLGVLYATEAYAATGSPTAQRALLEVLTADPRIERVWESVPGRCGARSPDGDTVGVVSEPDVEAGTAMVTLHDDDQRTISTFPVPAGVVCVVPDATGQWALAQLRGSQLPVPQLVVLDAASGQEVARIDVGSEFLLASPTAAEILVGDETGTVARWSLPSLDVVATYEHDLQPPFANPVWSDRGAAVLLPAPGVVRVVEEDGSVEVPYRGELRRVAAMDERRLLLVATTDELQVIPYDDPGAATTIGLQGEPTTIAEQLLVVADGRTVGVPTSRGLELFDVVAGASAGPPVELDVENISLTADLEGRIFATESNTSLAIDPSRRTHIGTMVTERDTSTAAFAGAAPDGSSYVVLDDTPSVRLSRSGSEVALPPGPPGPSPITFTFGIGLLEDEAWVRLDFATATFQRWSGDELELEVDLSDRLPTGMFTMGQVLDTTDEHVLAVVTDDPTLFRGYALVIDHRTGEVVGFFDPDEEIRGPRTFGVFAGDDRVMTYHVTGTMGLWTLRGDPAPGHVEVPNGGFGFDANADGSRLAIMRQDGTIGLLDGDGELLGDLPGVASYAFELAFVDDDRLVSRHFDGTTRLWDLDAGRLLGTLLRTGAHEGPVWRLTVDSEADQLLHPSPEGLLRLDLDPAAWLEAACGVVARGLRPDEVDAVAPGWTLQAPCRAGGEGASTTG